MIFPMYAVGRLLQLFGIVVAPMALFYYFFHQGELSESRLMMGELSILLVAAASFLLGNFFLRK
jgi:hypothetical protein